MNMNQLYKFKQFIYLLFYFLVQLFFAKYLTLPDLPLDVGLTLNTRCKDALGYLYFWFLSFMISSGCLVLRKEFYTAAVFKISIYIHYILPIRVVSSSLHILMYAFFTQAAIMLNDMDIDYVPLRSTVYIHLCCR